MNSRYRINMCRQCRMLKFFPTWACFHLYWASDGCLMQNKPFFTYIMARARYMHEMMMASVLAQWNRGDNSLLLLLNTVANTYFNVFFVWTDRDWNSGSTALKVIPLTITQPIRLYHLDINTRHYIGHTPYPQAIVMSITIFA